MYSIVYYFYIKSMKTFGAHIFTVFFLFISIRFYFKKLIIMTNIFIIRGTKCFVKDFLCNAYVITPYETDLSFRDWKSRDGGLTHLLKTT